MGAQAAAAGVSSECAAALTTNANGKKIMLTMRILSGNLPPPILRRTPGALGITRTIIRDPRTGRSRVLLTRGGQGFSVQTPYQRSRWLQFQAGPGGFVQAAVGRRRRQAPAQHRVELRQPSLRVPAPTPQDALLPRLRLRQPPPSPSPPLAPQPGGIVPPAMPTLRTPSPDVSERLLEARERLGIRGITSRRQHWYV